MIGGRRRSGRGTALLRWAVSAAACLALFATVGGSSLLAQGPDQVTVRFAGGVEAELGVSSHRGYPSLRAAEFEAMGWQLGRDGVVHRLLHRTGLELRFTPTSPYFRWDGELLQLVEAPYVFSGELFVPLQLLTDFFPALLPDAYQYDPDAALFRVAEGPIPGAPGIEGARDPAEATGPGEAERGPAEPVQDPDRRPRVVIIDPGHGGDEPGAIGPGGVREKEVALAIGLALARELSGDPDIEVRLTRDRDVAVPIWERGEMATEWKGDRVGVFVSIHANAAPDRPGVRGFETYFLSEARTEHERRVAAAENAPLFRNGPEEGDTPDPLLTAILRDLRTFDHQQWSSLLADLVQRELGTFHPGPDRGVKQGPFAVITNAMMPSVLVEVGFLTNREEERLMMRPEFHTDTARALANAVRTFFDRYPSAGR
ncbi:MAG: N-acetylmuramoyl-L-alanine amidase [Gemmatimonadales bacterium]|nr:MAG: N-acetylmuramoyl-L-alanine amidase [Gemmatimonadales bacterium]